MCKTVDATSHAIHDDTSGNRTKIQEYQFHDATCSGTLYATKDDKQHNEHRTNDERPQCAHIKQTANHRSRCEHLSYYTDEDTYQEQYRAQSLGLVTIFAAHEFEQGTAATAAQRTGIEHGKHYSSKRSAQCEPPCRDAIAERQLCSAHRRLATSQRGEKRATHHPAASSATCSETALILDVAGRQPTHQQQHRYCEHYAYNMCGRNHWLLGLF